MPNGFMTTGRRFSAPAGFIAFNSYGCESATLPFEGMEDETGSRLEATGVYATPLSMFTLDSTAPSAVRLKVSPGLVPGAVNPEALA